MKFLFFFANLVIWQQSLCQTTLTLDYKCKAPKGGFGQVTVIDKRNKDQYLGYVQLGALNTISNLQFKGNLQDSIAKFFLAKDNDSINNKLVIFLYDLLVSEKTDMYSETGRLKIGLRAFANRDSLYYEILNHDSLYTFNGLDVTKKLLKSVSEHFCEIANLTASRNKRIQLKNGYTLASLDKIDEIEKSLLPIYNNIAPREGIYYFYPQFASNYPTDTNFVVDSTKAGIELYRARSNGKRVLIEKTRIYGFCKNGKIYKATSKGYYRLQKIDSDFYYIGQTSFSNPNMAMAYAFGLIGAAIASATSDKDKDKYVYKINYLKGNSIPISIAPPDGIIKVK